MEAKAILAGAVTLAILGGTMMGSAIDTTPIQRGDDPLGSLPRHDFALRDFDRSSALRAPQDQYALETPEGRVEIADLSARGLYRNRSYDPQYDVDELETDYAASTDAQLERADWQPDVNFADAEIERSRLAARAKRVAEAARAAAGETTATGNDARHPRQGGSKPEASGAHAVGNARIVDVQAELASLN